MTWYTSRRRKQPLFLCGFAFLTVVGTGVFASAGAASGGPSASTGGGAGTIAVQWVSIKIDVSSPNRVSVVEKYRFSSPVSVIERAGFLYLNDPCAPVESISLRAGQDEIQFEQQSRGSWAFLFLRTPPPQETPWTLEISYDVSLREADAPIPVLLPASLLEATAGAGRGLIEVEVNAASSDQFTVALPQIPLVDPSGRWRRTFLAIPSLVSLQWKEGVAVQTSQTCRQGTREVGLFNWNFYGFLASLLLYVVLYFVWAGRRNTKEVGVAGR